jgi:CP family cyanate transporter-like MFS transporter
VLPALALVSINLRPAITTIAGVIGQLEATFGARAVAEALVVVAAALAVGVLVPVLLLPGTFLAGTAMMTASVLVPQIV